MPIGPEHASPATFTSMVCRTVDGFPMSSCVPDSLNSFWSQTPYDGTSNTLVGINNVVAGPCGDNNGNLTLLHFRPQYLENDASIQGNALAPSPLSAVALPVSCTHLHTSPCPSKLVVQIAAAAAAMKASAVACKVSTDADACST